MNDRLPNSGWITKTHFAFCRVNIYVNTRRIEFEKEEADRILPFHKSGMVAFADNGRDEAAFNRAPVYKDELLCPGLAAQAGLSDKAADRILGEPVLATATKRSNSSIPYKSRIRSLSVAAAGNWNNTRSSLNKEKPICG